MVDVGAKDETSRVAVATGMIRMLPATLALNLFALAFTWSIAIPLGIYAAVKQYKWPDKILSTFSFMGMSMPGFFLALVLLWIFASKLHWLPAGGLRDLNHDRYSPLGKLLDYGRHLILPVVVLAFGALAELQRISRGNMLETLRLQYITTARAKGLSPARVVAVHALRNALIPVITTIGLQVGVLMAGAILTETIFSWPGVGKWMVDSIFRRDYPAVQGGLLLIALIVMVVNLIVDLLYGLVNPRVRHGG